MRLAFACYLLFELAVVAFAGVYLTRREFMPYHAAVLNTSWAAVPPAVQTLILAFMRASGGFMLAFAAAFGVILFIPFRQGASWAKHALPVIGLLYCAANLVPTLHVALATSARTPWGMNAGGLVLMLIAWGFSLRPARPAAPCPQKT